jgi:hypothetical protein
MIFHRPRDKGEDLDIQESEERFKTIDLTIEAEGIIASAFLFGSPHPSPLPAGEREG